MAPKSFKSTPAVPVDHADASTTEVKKKHQKKKKKKKDQVVNAPALITPLLADGDTTTSAPKVAVPGDTTNALKTKKKNTRDLQVVVADPVVPVSTPIVAPASAPIVAPVPPSTSADVATSRPKQKLNANEIASNSSGQAPTVSSFDLQQIKKGTAVAATSTNTPSPLAPPAAFSHTTPVATSARSAPNAKSSTVSAPVDDHDSDSSAPPEPPCRKRRRSPPSTKQKATKRRKRQDRRYLRNTSGSDAGHEYVPVSNVSHTSGSEAGDGDDGGRAANEASDAESEVDHEITSNGRFHDDKAAWLSVYYPEWFRIHQTSGKGSVIIKRDWMNQFVSTYHEKWGWTTLDSKTAPLPPDWTVEQKVQELRTQFGNWFVANKGRALVAENKAQALTHLPYQLSNTDLKSKKRTRLEVFFKRNHPELYVNELAAAKRAAMVKGKGKRGSAMHNENAIILKCLYNQSQEFINDLTQRRNEAHKLMVAQAKADHAAQSTKAPTNEQMAIRWEDDLLDPHLVNICRHVAEHYDSIASIMIAGPNPNHGGRIEFRHIHVGTVKGKNWADRFVTLTEDVEVHMVRHATEIYPPEEQVARQYFPLPPLPSSAPLYLQSGNPLADNELMQFCEDVRMSDDDDDDDPMADEDVALVAELMTADHHAKSYHQVTSNHSQPQDDRPNTYQEPEGQDERAEEGDKKSTEKEGEHTGDKALESDDESGETSESDDESGEASESVDESREVSESKGESREVSEGKGESADVSECESESAEENQDESADHGVEGRMEGGEDNSEVQADDEDEDEDKDKDNDDDDDDVMVKSHVPVVEETDTDTDVQEVAHVPAVKQESLDGGSTDTIDWEAWYPTPEEWYGRLTASNSPLLVAAGLTQYHRYFFTTSTLKNSFGRYFKAVYNAAVALLAPLHDQPDRVSSWARADRLAWPRTLEEWAASGRPLVKNTPEDDIMIAGGLERYITAIMETSSEWGSINLRVDHLDLSAQGPYARLFCNAPGVQMLLYGFHTWASWLIAHHVTDKECLEDWTRTALILVSVFRGAAEWLNSLPNTTPPADNLEDDVARTPRPRRVDPQSTPTSGSNHGPAQPPPVAPVATASASIRAASLGTTSSHAVAVSDNNAEPSSPSPKRNAPASSQLSDLTEVGGEGVSRVAPGVAPKTLPSGSSSSVKDRPQGSKSGRVIKKVKR